MAADGMRVEDKQFRFEKEGVNGWEHRINGIKCSKS